MPEVPSKGGRLHATIAALVVAYLPIGYDPIMGVPQVEVAAYAPLGCRLAATARDGAVNEV